MSLCLSQHCPRHRLRSLHSPKPCLQPRSRASEAGPHRNARRDLHYLVAAEAPQSSRRACRSTARANICASDGMGAPKIPEPAFGLRLFVRAGDAGACWLIVPKMSEHEPAMTRRSGIIREGETSCRRRSGAIREGETSCRRQARRLRWKYRQGVHEGALSCAHSRASLDNRF